MERSEFFFLIIFVFWVWWPGLTNECERSSKFAKCQTGNIIHDFSKKYVTNILQKPFSFTYALWSAPGVSILTAQIVSMYLCAQCVQSGALGLRLYKYDCLATFLKRFPTKFKNDVFFISFIFDTKDTYTYALVSV